MILFIRFQLFFRGFFRLSVWFHLNSKIFHVLFENLAYVVKDECRNDVLGKSSSCSYFSKREENVNHLTNCWKTLDPHIMKFFRIFSKMKFDSRWWTMKMKLLKELRGEGRVSLHVLSAVSHNTYAHERTPVSNT